MGNRGMVAPNEMNILLLLLLFGQWTWTHKCKFVLYTEWRTQQNTTIAEIYIYKSFYTFIHLEFGIRQRQRSK